MLPQTFKYPCWQMLVMPESYELKPNRAAFVTYRFLMQLIFSLLVAAIIAIVLLVAVSSTAVLILALVCVLLQVWTYYSLTVRYSKEKYVFLRDRIVRKSGGVFSSMETELVIKNITHVLMKLPYLEHRLFGTGSIYIQSAGSGLVEVRLTSVGSPEKFYEYVERLMKANGFSLTRKNLVQREKPSSLGVFFEVFKSFLTLFIVFVYFFPSAIFGIIYLSRLGGAYVALLIFFAAVLFILLFGHFLLRFLDLKRRVYEIYSDAITYSEGFLSKNYAFIPMENLSDSEIKQTLVDKIFGLYDVKISCQGAGNEILFKNMNNGQALEENIDRLISSFKPLIGVAKAAVSASVTAEKQKQPARTQASLNPEYLAEFKMQMFRTLTPVFMIFAVVVFLMVIALMVSVFFMKVTGVEFALLGFVVTAFIMLVPVAIITLLSRIIKVASTRYLVKKESVEERYDFLSSKHKEFTNEKIMAVIFKESFIDAWFKTCSVHFWSIGSAESIKFSNIPKSSQLYNNILGKIGIRADEPIHSLGSEFSIADKLKAELFSTAFSAILLPGLLAAGIIFNFAFIIILFALLILGFLYFLYQNAYYKRSKMDFHKDFIHFRKGIFFKELYYAPNKNIKGITIVKYPFSRKGDVTFNVAGEHSVEVRTKRGRSNVIISNQFRISYVPDITSKDDFIDLMFYHKPASAEMVAKIEQYALKSVKKPLLVSKPAVANTLIPGMIIFAFISIALTAVLLLRLFSFPFMVPASISAAVLLFFLAVILPVIGVKVESYSIEPYRLVAKSGIIYKTQQSILLRKIDHINLIQGMLNKMFGNGTITVNTTGSSATEMFIRDIPDFKKFYELLQQRY